MPLRPWDGDPTMDGNLTLKSTPWRLALQETECFSVARINFGSFGSKVSAGFIAVENIVLFSLAKQ
jgi:hypothetical protein